MAREIAQFFLELEQSRNYLDLFLQTFLSLTSNQNGSFAVQSEDKIEQELLSLP